MEDHNAEVAVDVAVDVAGADSTVTQNDYSEFLEENQLPLLDLAPAEVTDIPAYCEQFSIRLHKATLPGRNRARDKTLLQVLCRLMQESKRTVFAASERYLSKEANMDRKTVTAALASLRENGYVLRVLRDSANRCYHYALVIDKLPEAVDGDALPKTNIAALNNAEFSHDAFHAKAWKRNYRLIYTHLLDHPGLTVAQIAREVKVAYNTAKVAVDWLHAEKMISIKGKKVYVWDRVIRKDRDLDIIAMNNHTDGKTKARMETYGMDWYTVKLWREGIRKATQANTQDERITKESDLEW